jgi:starch-binding outer membrane protein, SusD/RagB family
MKTKISKIFYIGFVSVFTILTIGIFPGCEDILDKQPLDKLSTATFWQSETDAMLGLTGVYYIKGQDRIGVSKQHWDLWNHDTFLRLFEATTDNGWEKDNGVTDINNGSLAPTYGPVNALWSSSYDKISRCNNFLENIGNAEINPATKAEMTAEVKTIRAYNYFYLSFLWGDVPLTKTVLTIAEANQISRTPKNEVVNFVIQELQDAITDLPATRPDSEKGRITKGGALAILGRVFLFNEKWTEAKNTYKQIIDMGIYSIDPKFSELFIEAGENSSEIILSSKRKPEVYASSIIRSVLGFTWGGFHHYSVYNELVEEFECIDGKPIDESPLYEIDNPYDNRDPRLLKTVGVPAVTVFKGILYVAHPDSSPSKYPDQVTRRPWSGYLVHKFADESYSGHPTSYGGDFPMARYAEVLLSYLEACIESNTAITQGLLDQTINQVRGREEIDMPPVTETDPNKLTEILRRERRVELAWEGFRHFDLIRWRTAHIILNGRFHGMKLCTKAEAPSYTKLPVNENGYFFNEETHFRENVDYLWPIPQSERDVNPNLEQNPGYQ